jgi:hypothetical protein
MELTAAHRQLLTRIGLAGAESTSVRLGREVDELKAAGLIALWPRGAAKPPGIHGGAELSGRWHLTLRGVGELDDLPPLRMQRP